MPFDASTILCWAIADESEAVADGARAKQVFVAEPTQTLRAQRSNPPLSNLVTIQKWLTSRGNSQPEIAEGLDGFASLAMTNRWRRHKILLRIGEEAASAPSLWWFELRNGPDRQQARRRGGPLATLDPELAAAAQAESVPLIGAP